MALRRLNIAVVGFGSAGAVAAILLARAGHRVTVFDQAAKLLPVGAGVLLQPVGQQVLARMGLLDAVAATAERVDEVHAVTHRRRDLVRLRYADHAPDACAYGVHRGDLFTVLERAARDAGVAFNLGQRVERIDESATGAHVITSGRGHGPYDFIIAADGSRSHLRTMSGLRCAVHPYNYAALWAVGRCTAVRGKLFQVTRGTANLCGLLPMGGGRCSLFWGLRIIDHEPLIACGFDRWRNEVLQLAPATAEVFETVDSFDAVAFARYQHVWLPRPFTHRTIFLGDAAHAMSPHLGQGVGLAMMDAWSLARAVECGTTVDAAFRTHHAARVNHLRYYGAVTFALAPFFQSDGWIKGRLRDFGLPLMPKVRPLRRLMTRTMAGYGLRRP